MNYVSMWLVWENFYRKESFDGTHLVCEWTISVPLQQMHIQGKHSRTIRQAYFLDTYSQGAPMWVVLWHAYLENSHCKAHGNCTWHGQLLKTKSQLAVCVLSVERLMPPNWKLTNTWYFILGKNNSAVNNVEKHFGRFFSSSAA